MKPYKLIILATLIMVFSSGCDMRTESAENLVGRPKFDIDKKSLEDGISKLLPPNTSFTLPSNSKDVGKINSVDLNGNGAEEVVAFKKIETLNEDSSNKVGFMILRNTNDNYSFDDEELIEGDSIEYANFYDLNSDGQKEIIILAKTKEKTTMYIYGYINNKIKKLSTVDPSWIENSDNLTDMKINIGKMDNDGLLDIVMVNLDSKTNEAYVSVLNFDSTLIHRDTTVLRNVKNISDMYLNIGKVSAKRRGVVVDIPILKGGYYSTNILYLQSGKIEKAFSDYEIIKPYYIPIRDIDNDKILEIPTNDVTYKSKDEANVTWYKWSGKKGYKLFTSQIYYNYKYNYKVFIPNNLSGKVIVEEELTNGKNQKSSVFKFYYYDVVDSDRKNLFNIIVESKSKDEKKNSNTHNPISLKETEDYNYILNINNVEEIAKLDLTAEAIKDYYFSLIYE
ncbi:hypothetical protein [Metaclostridioides mangenotii]|uniref:Lipoprotein n=1 Tax=Metaclostridioides mangenotii TaxID=1540 RepID=A0ABS4E7P9_9FIRM|nr:hypothetical protein [Clostridioides mangenotii]MBP1853948.1 hypothetical protein [Clostridioides mangenotii]